MNKSRSDWNNMKIVLSTLFISLLIQPALFGAEKCALMLEDDIDPEEYSEVMGKKSNFVVVLASRRSTKPPPTTSKLYLHLRKNSLTLKRKNLVLIK